jgi:putative pyruvate formate lyase activating enzyme
LGLDLRVARTLIHRGEEPPLVGTGGSGTVFLTGCTLHCCFCQNHQISQEGLGEITEPEILGARLVELQSAGCVNVNLVTPTAQLPGLLEALAVARKNGLDVPIVYNTGGYESTEILRHLEGVVDVYLPDFKYGCDASARRFSSAPDYAVHALAAIQEMYRQVGPLETRDGVARRGLIVRHLVLPDNLARTDRVLRLLAEDVSRDLALSLMAQYQPAYRASEFTEVNRRLRRDEYEKAVELAESLGFRHGWFQELEEIDGEFLPDFNLDSPFQ